MAELQPCAILAKGPPWTKAGLFSSVCTRLGSSASLSSTVIHVHYAAPGDAAGIEAELIAPIDVVVDHRREEIVRRGDGVKVAGEMQVDIFHRHDLRIAAAGCTALHAEAGAERGLAQANHRLLADPVEAAGDSVRR